MKYYNKIMLVFLLVMGHQYVQAQLDLTGDYKLKSEFANGYKQPLFSTQEPGFYISQRARLGAKYKYSKFEFNFALQDVRTWGNSDYFGMDNAGLLSIYQANVSIFFKDYLSLKLGRQSIEYDNERIFSKSAWALQEIRHDAAILKFDKSGWKADLGLAYNQNANSLTQTFYTLNQYKTFQFLWLHKDWKEWSASFLFLNNGMQEVYMQDTIQKKRTNYSQTFGTQIDYKKKKFDMEFFAYYQMGFSEIRQAISAYDLGLTLGYQSVKGFKIALGGEFLSGTSQFSTDNRNYSFQPFYTSRHKFSGAMDYFYSNNHIDNVGLIDGHLKLNYKYKDFTFGLANHVFFSGADIRGINDDLTVYKEDPYLGYELDFSFGYQFIDEVLIQAGYSQLFGTATLQNLKGVDQMPLNNWAYVMVTVFPFKNLKLGEHKKAE